MKFLFFLKLELKGVSVDIHYAFFCCFLISTMAHCNIKTDLSWVSVHSFSTWVFPEIYRTNNHTYSADWCYPDNLTLCKSCKFRNHFYVFHVGWVVWWWWNWRQCLCKLLTLAMLPLKKKKDRASFRSLEGSRGTTNSSCSSPTCCCICFWLLVIENIIIWRIHFSHHFHRMWNAGNIVPVLFHYFKIYWILLG